MSSTESAAPGTAEAKTDISESKQQAKTDISESKQQVDKAFKVISFGVLMNSIAMSLTWGARENIALENTGDVAKAATFLANITGLGAMLELFINPIIGKVSDAIGRRQILTFAPLGKSLVTALVASQGTLLSLSVEKIIATALTTGFFTIYRAALSDVLLKIKAVEEFAVKNALISACIGLGYIVGPKLGSLVNTSASKHGWRGDRVAFFASSVAELLTCLFFAKSFDETLPKAERCKLTRQSMLQDMQPLSFTQVWGASPALSKMFFATGFQTFSEPRNISPVNYLLVTQDFKWSQDWYANLLAGFGFTLMAGGVLAKRQLKMLGMRWFTTVSNCFNSASLMLQGLAMVIEKAIGLRTPYTFVLGILLLIPGARKRDAIESVMLLSGDEAGFGRGFMSAAMMNFRALFNVVTPSTLGYMYAWGKSNGRNAPYVPWIVGSMTNLVAEGIFQTLTNKDLFIDAQGNSISEKTEDGKEVKQ